MRFVWQNEDEEIDLANVIDTVDLHGHLERLKAKFPNTPAFRNKYQKIVTTLDLLSDRREIGLAQRIVVSQRARRASFIGAKLKVPLSVKRRERSVENSLRVEEEGVGYTQRVYANSTKKDQSSRSRDLMRGFARTNVPTCSGHVEVLIRDLS